MVAAGCAGPQLATSPVTRSDEVEASIMMQSEALPPELQTSGVEQVEIVRRVERRIRPATEKVCARPRDVPEAVLEDHGAREARGRHHQRGREHRRERHVLRRTGAARGKRRRGRRRDGPRDGPRAAQAAAEHPLSGW